jgi:hypothetical protein
MTELRVVTSRITYIKMMLGKSNCKFRTKFQTELSILEKRRQELREIQVEPDYITCIECNKPLPKEKFNLMVRHYQAVDGTIHEHRNRAKKCNTCKNKQRPSRSKKLSRMSKVASQIKDAFIICGLRIF